MNNNTKQLKCSEDALRVSQTYTDQFNVLDVKQQGYLEENEAQLYFSSINFGKELEMIWSSIHDMKDRGHLTMNQFIIIMFLVQYRHESISIDQDSTNRLTEFSQSLHHFEESLRKIELYRFFSLVTLEELHRKLSKAFFEFEDMLRQISKSDTSQTFNLVEENLDMIPSPAQEKVMPGSFRDEKQVPKSTSLPQDNPGFLDQSHKEASTLTLRSQPISFKNSHEPYDLDDALDKSDVVQSVSSIPDVISDIATSITGLADLIGLSNSSKPETRGLDTAQETNRDIVVPSQAETSPIKPKDDTISIDPPVNLNNSDANKKLTDDELNRGADALKEMGQSIPVTGSFPSKYTHTQHNRYSYSESSIKNSNASDTNIHDITDDTIKARPELIQNEDGSFGYATIIVPGKVVSKDMQQDALQGARKVQSDMDTCTPSNNASEYLVIDNNDGNTGAAQTDDILAKRSDEIERLEHDIEQQLDILSNSASSDNESSHHPSPTSKSAKPARLKSHIFQDKSTAEAIESLANSPDTKHASMDGQERVLYVRDGFENFIGFGLKCLSKDRPSSIKKKFSS